VAEGHSMIYEMNAVSSSDSEGKQSDKQVGRHPHGRVTMVLVTPTIVQ
jgi:hypothetical protein